MTEQAAKQWYIAREGKQTGPISDVEINTIAGMGYFRESDLVWRPGLAEWMPALSQFPPRAAAPPPPAPPAAAPMAAPAQAPYTMASQPAAYMPQEPATGRPRAPEPLQAAPQPARTLPIQTPASQRTGAPQGYQAPGAVSADPRMAIDPRRDTTARPTQTKPAASQTGRSEGTARSKSKPKKSRAGAVFGLLLLLALAGGGAWLFTHPDQFKLAQDYVAGLTPAKPAATAPAPVASETTQPVPSGPEPTASELAAIDDKLQHTAHWPVLKRVFPDWYAGRLRDAARLKAERRSDDDINKALAEQIVALRRQNVSQALSASAPKLKALATAFLENLKQLKSQSTTTCYNFISRGETTPGVVALLEVTKPPPPLLQLQIVAIFDAIDEGRTAPITHQRPQKPDFDVLMSQLAKLGWTQTDVATFADPDKLARAEPDRVCQMVQDWFVAHVSIPDPAVQERLLSETLRPVIAG